jgi:alpha-D-xyloside xylohydrolase
VRDGTVIPRIKLAQSTMQMDWSNLELVAFAAPIDQRVRLTGPAKGLVCLPSDNVLREVSLLRTSQPDGAFQLTSDPLAGKVTWKIRAYPDR